MVVPMFRLTGPEDLALGLVPGATDAVGEVSFLGYSPTGPAGILRPGQRVTVRFYTPPLELGSYHFSLSSMWVDPANPGAQPVDWDSYGQQVRSPYANPQETEALWTVVAAQVGASWQDVLVNLAGRLTSEPVDSEGRPNILADGFLQDLVEDAMSRGGGLTDHESPWILGHVPQVDSTGRAVGMDLVFSESIEPESFSAAQLSLSGPGGLYVGSLTLTRLSDRLYRVELPPATAAGTYHLTVAPVLTDLVGQAMDQDRDGLAGEVGDDTYDAAFRLDDGGQLSDDLYVTWHLPGGVREQGEGVDHVTVCFSQPIFSSTFTPADVHVLTPDGEVRATSVTALSATIFQVEFSAPGRPGRIQR